MKWISVEDRLPEDERRVAIVYRYKGTRIVRTFIGEYNPLKERWYNVIDSITVTHWMPLPEPPDE